MDAVDGLGARMATRLRELRAARDLSLDALSARSGVSRSMISLIERGESSPTAIVLDKLAGALGLTIAALFDSPSAANEEPPGPVARRKNQPEWRDPSSGYVRRNVSPSATAQPVQIVDVHFPAGARVAFDTASRGVRIHQQIWVLEGALDITFGSERHRLHSGDCLAMTLDQPIMFHNPTRKPTRYAVVIVTEARR